MAATPSIGPSVGIDFGTTNSAVAYTKPNGSVAMVNFPSADGPVTTSRSVLYAQQQISLPGRPINIWTGPAAIEHSSPPAITTPMSTAASSSPSKATSPPAP